jgi:hypothetical protein
MVHTVHPAWGNRSCLRFGIYSETAEDEHTRVVKARNNRLHYGVVTGMVSVAMLLVST